MFRELKTTQKKQNIGHGDLDIPSGGRVLSFTGMRESAKLERLVHCTSVLALAPGLVIVRVFAGNRAPRDDFCLCWREPIAGPDNRNGVLLFGVGGSLQ